MPLPARHDQCVADGTRSGQVRGPVHHLAAHDHRRRSAAIEVEGVRRAKSCKQHLHLGERHADGVARLPAVNRDQPPRAVAIARNDGARVRRRLESLRQALDRPLPQGPALLNQQACTADERARTCPLRTCRPLRTASDSRTWTAGARVSPVSAGGVSCPPYESTKPVGGMGALPSVVV